MLEQACCLLRDLNYTAEKWWWLRQYRTGSGYYAAFENQSSVFGLLPCRARLMPHLKSLFIDVPHQSFVWGERNVNMLKRRHAAMSAHPALKKCNTRKIAKKNEEWMPLIMNNRDGKWTSGRQRVFEHGTDVNFGRYCSAIWVSIRRLETFDSNLNCEAKRT